MSCSTTEEGFKALSSPSRNIFFYGKLMDRQHWEMEARYTRLLRALNNRLSLGAGVLCGAGVTVSTDGKGVCVAPGALVDFWGREVVIPATSRPVNPWQPTDACGHPEGDALGAGEVVTLYACYHECPTEPMPVMVGDCDPGPRCSPGTLRERYNLSIRKGPPPAVALQCGFPNLFNPAPNAPPMYARLAERVSQPYPAVPDNPCVPLALIKLPAPNAPLKAEMIDTAVRPIIFGNELLKEMIVCLSQQGAGGGGTGPQGPTGPTGPQGPQGPQGEGLEKNLTRIKDVAPAFEQTVPINQFMSKGVEIGCTRKVKAVGAGRGWLTVDVEYPVQEMAPPFAAWPGTILVQRVLDKSIEVADETIRFRPLGAFKDTFGRASSVMGRPVLCRVRLRCDFILDAETDRPIDGDFLGAKFPTGDRVGGGEFETWFFIGEPG